MNPSRRARVDLRIVREDDPEHDRLIARGWRIVSRSWGARLTLADGADVSALEAALDAARRAGYVVRRLDAAYSIISGNHVPLWRFSFIP